MKRKLYWNIRLTVGTLIGVLSPLLVIPLTVWILSYVQHFYFSVLWNKFLHDMIVQSKFISLSIIPNLLWFFFFLNRERYDLARGIIIGSALHLPFIIYINLIR
jgi:hypothetical protein